MKKLLILLSIIACGLFCSCGDSSGNYIVSFKADMETQKAWTDFPLPNIVRNPNANSGKYVCKLDSVNAYSPTFNMRVSDISDLKFKRVKIMAYIKAENLDVQPNLVLDIRDANGKTIEWLAKPFTGPMLNLKNWEYYEYNINLEEKNRLKESNTYRIYVSNGKSSAVLCDDIEIGFY